jgi:hypothetical protein
MTTIERISQQTRKLPEPFQMEVLHFAEFLANKTKTSVEGSRQEDLKWYDIPLAGAMRGIEDAADKETIVPPGESDGEPLPQGEKGNGEN